MFPGRIHNTLDEALAADERSYAWLGRKLGVNRLTVNRWAKGVHEPDEETKARAAIILQRDVTVIWPTVADSGSSEAAA